MSREDHDRLSTADLVAGTDARQAERPPIQSQERRESRQVEEMQEMPPEPAAARDAQVREQQMREQQARDMQMREPQMREPQMREADARRDRPATAGGMGQEMEQLAALFPPEMAANFRNHWDQVQIGFVDDPRRAVQQADELVAQVMKNLASSFAEQRARLEAGLGKGDEVNTENLRMALRGYRSFFQRLLSL